MSSEERGFDIELKDIEMLEANLNTYDFNFLKALEGDLSSLNEEVIKKLCTEKGTLSDAVKIAEAIVRIKRKLPAAIAENDKKNKEIQKDYYQEKAKLGALANEAGQLLEESSNPENTFNTSREKLKDCLDRINLILESYAAEDNVNVKNDKEIQGLVQKITEYRPQIQQTLRDLDKRGKYDLALELFSEDVNNLDIDDLKRKIKQIYPLIEQEANALKVHDLQTAEGNKEALEALEKLCTQFEGLIGYGKARYNYGDRNFEETGQEVYIRGVQKKTRELLGYAGELKVEEVPIEDKLANKRGKPLTEKEEGRIKNDFDKELTKWATEAKFAVVDVRLEHLEACVQELYGRTNQKDPKVDYSIFVTVLKMNPAAAKVIEFGEIANQTYIFFKSVVDKKNFVTKKNLSGKLSEIVKEWESVIEAIKGEKEVLFQKMFSELKVKKSDKVDIATLEETVLASIGLLPKAEDIRSQIRKAMNAAGIGMGYVDVKLVASGPSYTKKSVKIGGINEGAQALVDFLIKEKGGDTPVVESGLDVKFHIISSTLTPEAFGDALLFKDGGLKISIAKGNLSNYKVDEGDKEDAKKFLKRSATLVKLKDIKI